MKTRISIHRSLAGPDVRDFRDTLRFVDISIHRSLAGPDDSGSKIYHRHAISIHRSLAGPDQPDGRRGSRVHDFNPQVPCGTRLLTLGKLLDSKVFQSTGPLRDPTSDINAIGHITWKFQSTGPLRDPTADNVPGAIEMLFQSTGPLRDPTCRLSSSRTVHRFQSTGPLRDPTDIYTIQKLLGHISIHRSLAGPD